MYTIAGINLELQIEERLLHERLLQYRSDPAVKPDICVSMEEGYQLPAGFRPVPAPPMNCAIYETDTEWMFDMKERTLFPCAFRAAKDWKQVILYCSRESRKDLERLFPDQEVRTGRMQAFLFQTLMHIFRFALPDFCGLYLHGVLMEYQGMGLAFSAPSGTGKTTHTSLWVKKYGVEILNGDNYIVRVNGQKMEAYSPPWCGSSNICRNTVLPFHGTVFLEQAAVNTAKVMEPSEAYMNYMLRTWLPRWSAGAMEKAMDAAVYLAEQSCCYKLFCTPEEEAVEVLKKCLRI